MLDAMAFAMRLFGSMPSHNGGVCPADVPVCPSLYITEAAGKNACRQMVMRPRGAEPAQASGVYSAGT